MMARSFSNQLKQILRPTTKFQTFKVEPLSLRFHDELTTHHAKLSCQLHHQKPNGMYSRGLLCANPRKRLGVNPIVDVVNRANSEKSSLVA